MNAARTCRRWVVDIKYSIETHILDFRLAFPIGNPENYDLASDRMKCLIWITFCLGIVFPPLFLFVLENKVDIIIWLEMVDIGIQTLYLIDVNWYSIMWLLIGTFGLHGILKFIFLIGPRLCWCKDMMDGYRKKWRREDPGWDTTLNSKRIINYMMNQINWMFAVWIGKLISNIFVQKWYIKSHDSSGAQAVFSGFKWFCCMVVWTINTYSIGVYFATMFSHELIEELFSPNLGQLGSNTTRLSFVFCFMFNISALTSCTIFFMIESELKQAIEVLFVYFGLADIIVTFVNTFVWFIIKMVDHFKNHYVPPPPPSPREIADGQLDAFIDGDDDDDDDDDDSSD